MFELAIAALLGALAPAPPARAPSPLTSALEAKIIAECTRPDAVPTRKWRVSRWGRDFAVALSFEPITATDDLALAKPELCLLERHASRFAKVASGHVTIAESNCGNQPEASQDPPDFQLDLARYVTAPGVLALGVRSTCNNSFPAGEGDESRLYLFEQHRAQLVQVLDERVGSLYHDRVGQADTTERGVLIVQKKQHGDHFDLTMRSEITKLPFEAGRKVVTHESYTLVWNADHYTRKSAAPSAKSR